jgi:2-polyprenyl-3-methyl-5-hydroxy-6-metoxy-1,4-benzoquinol methylase
VIAVQKRGFDGGGNYYNKYESKNPIVKILMKRYFQDLDSLILPINEKISCALEIGCGEGYITKHINDIGITIEGADVSERVIKTAQTMHPTIQFSVCSIYDLKPLGKKYDLVMANEVFEHLDDINSAIEEIKNITNQYLFFSVPNEPYFRLANVARLKYLKDLGNTPGHINHWSIRSFKKLLRNANLTTIDIRPSSLWIMALCEI